MTDGNQSDGLTKKNLLFICKISNSNRFHILMYTNLNLVNTQDRFQRKTMAWDLKVVAVCGGREYKVLT